jgi:formimidoylglutamate deiminase
MGRKVGKIEVGYQADIIVLDDEQLELAHKPADLIFDSMIFAGNHNLVRDVFVGGKPVISEGAHQHDKNARVNFDAVLKNTIRQ